MATHNSETVAAPHLDFLRPAPNVAQELIGWTVLVNGVGGAIIETEAYEVDDEASHSFNGKTARNASMFGSPGRAYIYLSYGIHWCLNFVCGPEGHGAAVLLRALEPSHGLAQMRARRRTDNPRLLTSGPGRLAQALGIDRSLDGCSVLQLPFELRPPVCRGDVICGPRIGITKAAHHPWRFGVAGSAYLSRPFRE